MTEAATLLSPTEMDSLTRHHSPPPRVSPPSPPSPPSSPESPQYPQSPLFLRPPPVQIQIPSPVVLPIDVSSNNVRNNDDSASQNRTRKLSRKLGNTDIVFIPAPPSTRMSSASSAWEHLWVDNKVLRAISHTLFCCVCSTSFLISALPRVLVALDVFITVGLMVHFESQRGTVPFENVLNWLQHSDFDVVLLAVLRAIVLFQCYSYKFHTNVVAVSACWTTSGLSALFVSLKVVYLHDYTNRLIFLLTNLSLICMEHVLYVMTKRKKILVAAALKLPSRDHSASEVEDQSNVVHLADEMEDPLSPHEFNLFYPKSGGAAGGFSEHTVVHELRNLHKVS